MPLKRWMISAVVAGLATTAQAAFVTSVDDDTAMNALIQNKAWVAEARAGNLKHNGDHEQNIHTNAGVQAQAQRTWVAGGSVDFTLNYSGGLLKYTLGGSELAYAANDPVTDIFIRTRSVFTNGSQEQSILVENLVLNGTSLSASSTASGPNDLDIIRIGGLDPLADLSLTGTVTLDWRGRPPSNSRLAAQIKAGTTVPAGPPVIPAPTSLGAALLGLSCLLLMRGRH